MLDIGSWVSGPMVATILGDFGAEVIKVERPRTGDPARSLGMDHRGTGMWWPSLARNKYGITLDLKSDEGQALFLDLVRKSDAVVENFRPGTLERLGLGPESLLGVNPGVVVVRMSGFGQTGPLRDLAGFDRVAQAYGGMTHMTGHPESPPVRAGMSVADVGSAIWAAFGAVTALYWRDRTGTRGQVVDMALYEALVPYWFDMPIEYQLHGTIQQRTGNRHPSVAPGDVYRTADDRWVHISATGDPSFARLAAAMGRTELVDDPRFRTNADRTRHAGEIESEVAGWAAGLELDAILERCEQHAVPAARVMSMADIHADAHIWERGDLVEVDDPRFGPLHVSGVVPKLSATPGRIVHLGPGEPGQDNEYVYGEILGLKASEIADLQARGIV